MKKQEAIELFGNQSQLAKAIGCTRSAISQWPDELPQRTSDQVIGACLRHGKDISMFLEEQAREAA